MGPGSCAENPKTERGPVQREDSRWHVRLTSSWTGLGQRGEAQKAPARIVQDGAAEFLRVTISGAINNGKNLENSGLSEIKQITFFLQEFLEPSICKCVRNLSERRCNMGNS